MSRLNHHPFPTIAIDDSTVPEMLRQRLLVEPPGAGPLYAGSRIHRCTLEERKELRALSRQRWLDATATARKTVLTAASAEQTFVVRWNLPREGGPRVKRMRLLLTESATPPESHAFGWGPGEPGRMLAEGILRDACDGGSVPPASIEKLTLRIAALTDVWVLSRADVLRIVAVDEIYRVTRRARLLGFSLGEIVAEVTAAAARIEVATAAEASG